MGNKVMDAVMTVATEFGPDVARNVAPYALAAVKPAMVATANLVVAALPAVCVAAAGVAVGVGVFKLTKWLSKA